MFKEPHEKSLLNVPYIFSGDFMWPVINNFKVWDFYDSIVLCNIMEFSKSSAADF